MKTGHSKAVEDYLKAIYDLVTAHGQASTNQIAETLRVTPASVSGMLRKLAQETPPLIEYQKHRGARLTPEGQKIALEVIRHHRLLETFLFQTLGYPWDEVDAEADRLEHVISAHMEERIAQALGHPQYDPHGDPIPNRELEVPPTSWAPLTDLRIGQQGIVRRVRDGNPDLLRYLARHKVFPKTRIAVVGYREFDNNIQIKNLDTEEIITLGQGITCKIFVELEPETPPSE